ncbi:MAG: hypothetical protein C0402_00645, partial [Thermodesulfovibrio sp.]|nr:hypothetical protein [Thermodesulfovibrio sp.]
MSHGKKAMKRSVALLVLFIMMTVAGRAAATSWTGPDSAGYTGSTPAYSFTDISGSGGTLLSLGDDALSGAIPLGFSFNFYGTQYSSVHVSSNGFLTFGSSVDTGCCDGRNLNTSFLSPNTLVAGYWTDLNPDPINGGGTIHYRTAGSPGSRTFTVQFLNVPLVGGTTTASFQIILHEGTNSIEMQFQSCTVSGDRIVTTGISNEDNSSSLQYNFGSYSLQNTARLFSPPAITLAAQPVDQTVCSGGSAAFTASATSPLTPTVQWQVSTNGGANYSNIPGATSPTLNIPGDPAQSGNLFRAVFTNWAGTATTSAGLLTVGSLSVTSPAITSGVT